MSHAPTERLRALSGATSCHVLAHVRQACYASFPRTAAHTSVAAAASDAAATTPGTKILLVIIAVLITAVAGLIVGVLGHEGDVRKSVLRGLYVFGGAIVGCVVIEGVLGLL